MSALNYTSCPNYTFCDLKRRRWFNMLSSASGEEWWAALIFFSARVSARLNLGLGVLTF
ncbi:hypothetical protein MANES_11G101150v8 [Manihot esculenta]|uniref:Uncharacterized protein n=1 Tax=Manihot esculenta TaxID=3983 RepID=A0ACB7GWI7_MANES|nr:hypothetical protein MANES_11G101150v8 [Manihot esculenta]